MAGRHILVVDDERQAADLLKLILEAEEGDRTVAVAYDGQQAVAMAQARRPDIVIMDLEMPLMDGEDAASFIAAQYHFNPPLLIALSGNVLRLADLEAAGPFQHQLRKPVDFAVLMPLLA